MLHVLLHVVVNLVSNILNSVHHLVYCCLLLLQERPDEARVDEAGTVVVDHPEQEGALDERVEGNPEQEVVGEEFQDSEVAVDNPVCEPLGIITGISALYRFEREISREDESDEVAEEGSTVADSEPDCCEGSLP